MNVVPLAREPALPQLRFSAPAPVQRDAVDADEDPDASQRARGRGAPLSLILRQRCDDGEDGAGYG